MNYTEWKELQKEGYSADAILLLQFIQRGEVLDKLDFKTYSYYSTLQRKSAIDSEGKITETGRKLLDYLKEPDFMEVLSSNVREVKRPPSKFDEWWTVYPATNNFTYNGVTFVGVQTKRKEKPKCKALFDKCVAEGTSADDIIRATQYHFDLARKLSFDTRDNKLTYINGSEIYLRNKVFEPYIELSRNSVQVTETYKSEIE